MDIQLNLERAIHQLVDEFLNEPYRFFTEADAISRFHQLLDADAQLNVRVLSKDGVSLSTIHQQYPTFFRFDDAQPTARLDASSKARRGQYDIAILSPEFIRKHPVETIKNRDLAGERIKHIRPFQALVEFKLDDRGWNSGKTQGAVAELGKLILSNEEADLRYFVGLMRYTAPTESRWNKYWPEVTQAAMAGMEIRSIFATYRLLQAQHPHVQRFGDWLTKQEEAGKNEARIKVK